MTSSASKMSENKLKLKDAEGDPLKQLELLESSTCYQAIGVFSLYNELETVGELRMQHVQHIGMRGHIKDFTANKEGKVIANRQATGGVHSQGYLYCIAMGMGGGVCTAVVTS